MKNYHLSESVDNQNFDVFGIKQKLTKDFYVNKARTPKKHNYTNKSSGTLDSIEKDKLRDSSNKRLKRNLICTPLEEDSKKESEILPIFQSNGFNLLSVDEVNDRRFNAISINKYKDLFKNRYVSDKATNDINISTNNLRLTTQKSVEVKAFFNESPKHGNIQTKHSLHFAPDNRNVIKYASCYIQKLQKAILLFNSKKFEESYNYLVNKGIIFNEKEFAQLLLITNGFDKSVIGIFLSKPKPPNKDYQILNNFINAMLFTEMEFTKAFRFLLSRINLPQDSGLMLKIIEVFSSCFYNDNNSTGYYRDDTSIYILSSTSLAINTLFNRKDIVNVQIISKEKFVSMNNTTSEAVAANVYEEIKLKKLDIVYDYTEMFNKRLGRIISAENEEILQTLTNNKSIDKKKSSVDLSIHLEDIRIGNIEGDQLLEFLKKGSQFLKYCPNAKEHFRYVYLNKNESKVYWNKISFCKIFKFPKSMNVRELFGVYIGSGHSKVFDKACISPEFDQYCFTIESTKRTLDLRNDNDEICNKWYKGIKYLIQRNLSSFNLKDVFPSIINNIEEKVSLVWEGEILPNWGFFRLFMFIKEKFAIDNNYINQKKSLLNKLQIPLGSKDKVINPQNKNDFIFIYIHFGIPVWLRSKLWQILIPNNLNITTEMFNKANGSLSKIEINQMDKDITKLSNAIIKNNKLNASIQLFSEKMTQLIKTFFYMRNDIIYSKNFAYFCSIFLLNSESPFDAFILFINFIYFKCDFVLKFSLRDECFIKKRIDFFEYIFRNTLPKLFRHFHDFDISTNLFFYNWYEFLFGKYFFKKYSLLLRLWDIFLIKGELFIFELGIVLLKLLEKRFLNLAIKDILKDLKHFPDEIIKERDLMDGLEEINLSSKYCTMNYDDIISKEKGILIKKKPPLEYQDI